MSEPVVAVRGTAQHSAPPDSFVLGVAVEVRGPEAASVNAELAERFSTVDGSLAALTSPTVTLVRRPLSVRRDTWLPEGSDRPTVEWVATRAITLTGTDPAEAAAVIDVVSQLADQVKGLVISGPHWELDDANPIHAAVQTAAVREAEARAARYAEAVGGRLGRLIEIADRDMHVYRAAALGLGGGGLAAMDFTPEPVEVNATVEGRWLIELR